MTNRKAAEILKGERKWVLGPQREGYGNCYPRKDQSWKERRVQGGEWGVGGGQLGWEKKKKTSSKEN